MAFEKMLDHSTQDVREIDLEEPTFHYPEVNPSRIDVRVDADMQIAKFRTETALEMVKTLTVVDPIQVIPQETEHFSGQPMIVLQGCFAVHKRNHAQIGFLNAFVT